MNQYSNISDNLMGLPALFFGPVKPTNRSKATKIAPKPWTMRKTKKHDSHFEQTQRFGHRSIVELATSEIADHEATSDALVIATQYCSITFIEVVKW